MNFSTISSIFLLTLIGAAAAYRYPRFAGGVKGQISQRYEQEPIEQQQTQQTWGEANPEPYSFSYETPEGILSRSSQQSSRLTDESSSSDVAQIGHQQTSDGRGNVRGKYAYVDAYGKLRVVSYTAGPNGFQPTGDIGPDNNDLLRQQRELYANDLSYQLQQKAWQQVARGEQVNIGQDIEAAVRSATASSASASAAASSAAQSDWTSVNNNNHNQGFSGNYATKNNQFAERYTAAGGFKSPSAQLREQSTSSSYDQSSQLSKTTKISSSSASSAAGSSAYTSSAYTAPQTVQYSTKTVQQPIVKQIQVVETKTVVRPQPARLVAPPPQAVKSTKSAYTQQQRYTSGFQSPAARLTAISSSGAASSASASASASSSAYSGAYTSGGVKGYSGAIKGAPLRVQQTKFARYASPPGRTVVNFSQGGPVPYAYNYSFK